ncbi:hypothetical protein MTP99_017927 [Tenebrio molitor]|nr:hypothetical protein MTP99_017927 [Tenebrio molitor]
MKPLFALLLLLVVVSVVRGKKCYDCYEKCSEDDVLELDCLSDEANCLSVTVTDSNAKRVSAKSCVPSKITEKELCQAYKHNGDKCYVCEDELCNKNDDK